MADSERRSLLIIMLLAALGCTVLVASVRITGNAALHQTYDETERSPYFFVLHMGEDGTWRPAILEEATTHPTAYRDSAPTVPTPTRDTIGNFVLTPEALEQLEATRIAERAVWMESGVLLSEAREVTIGPEGQQEISIQLALGESFGRFKYRVDPARGELVPLQFGYFTKRVAFIGVFVGSIGAAAVVAAVCFLLDARERRRTLRRMARGRAVMWVLAAVFGLGAASLISISCIGLALLPCFLLAVTWLALTRDTVRNPQHEQLITMQ